LNSATTPPISSWRTIGSSLVVPAQRSSRIAMASLASGRRMYALPSSKPSPAVTTPNAITVRMMARRVSARSA